MAHKAKTCKSAAKRFRACGKGKNGVERIKFRSANRNHILTKKAPKRRAQLAKSGTVKHCDVMRIKRLLRLA